MENEAVKEIIKTKELTFDYIRHDEEGNEEGTIRAVDNVSLEVKQGDFIAILGHNGSGKSTLAKHINALLVPTSGTVWVDGRVTAEESNVWDIRQTAGMVFQNPDNQIIGQVVEEDVGFGPENMGVPTKEIWERVEESLKAVGMYEYRKYSPNKRFRRTEAESIHCGCPGHASQVHRAGRAYGDAGSSGRREVIRAARR